MEHPPECPDCGTQARPIIYGYPTYEAFEASRRGEFRLGGCIVDDRNPQWWCPNCDLEFPTHPDAGPEEPEEGSEQQT